MTTRSKNIVGLLAFAAMSVLVVWFIRREQRKKRRAIDAVPADAFLVLTIDVDRLRDSPLRSVILGGADSKLLGEKTIATTCGFDPLDRMREVAVAVPQEDDTGEFGIVVQADISKGELLSCAEKVMKAREGGAHASIRESGSFTRVEPDGDLQKRYPTLAYRNGGPFLIARGTWLGTMIDTVEGKLPSARGESEHLALRRALGQTSEGASNAAFLATVVLPKAMRERIRADMEAEAGANDETRSALAAGILGVEAAGVAVDPGRTGGDASVVVYVMCDAEPACAAAEKLVVEKRDEWTKDVAIRLLGLGPLLDHVVVENLGKSLRISTHAPSSDAASGLERVLELRSARHPTAGPLATTSPAPRVPPSADEVVRAKPDGGAPRGPIAPAMSDGGGARAD